MFFDIPQDQDRLGLLPVPGVEPLPEQREKIERLGLEVELFSILEYQQFTMSDRLTEIRDTFPSVNHPHYHRRNFPRGGFAISLDVTPSF